LQGRVTTVTTNKSPNKREQHGRYLHPAFDRVRPTPHPKIDIHF
jgi:hypothetical protein